jgi:hypothetical protein
MSAPSVQALGAFYCPWGTDGTMASIALNETEQLLSRKKISISSYF